MIHQPIIPSQSLKTRATEDHNLQSALVTRASKTTTYARVNADAPKNGLRAVRVNWFKCVITLVAHRNETPFSQSIRVTVVDCVSKIHAELHF